SDREARGTMPQHLAGPAGGSRPDPVFFVALRSGSDAWMLDQEDRLIGVRLASERVAPARRPTRTRTKPVTPVLLAEQRSSVPAALPRVDPTDRSRPGAIGVLDGEGTFGTEPSVAALRRSISTDSIVPARDLLAALSLAEPDGRPALPPAQPEPSGEAGPGDAGGTTTRIMVFLYYDDTRLKTHPAVGDPWSAMMSPETADAVRSSDVTAVRELLQVQAWCTAGGTDGDSGTAWLSDRYRLLEVALTVETEAVEQLEAEIPVFNGTPSIMFHNLSPLIGGLSNDPVMDTATQLVGGLSNRTMDPNTPADLPGGQYFVSRDRLAYELERAGCVDLVWNDGSGPVNRIGHAMVSSRGG
ncbi:MAG: hypothetical protein AAF334_08980, partial [Pseudomonadota bacterium]